MSTMLMGLPKGFGALVSNLAAQKAAGRPVKPARKTLLAAARAAVARGELPPLLEFDSITNASYNAHTKALRDLAAAGDKAGLVAYQVGGSNTYARAVRGYRDLMVEFVDCSAIASSLVKAQNAAAAGKAKAITAKAKAAPKAAKQKAKATSKA